MTSVQDRVIKISLLGVGNMGQNHLRNLAMLKNVEICFVYDKCEEVLKAQSLKYNIPATSDLNEALQAADGVIIATPTITHFDYFKVAANFVKYVFIEKPLTSSSDSAYLIERIAIDNKITVQVGFIERYNPAILGLKQIIKEEQVVNIDFCRTNRLSNRIKDIDVVLDLMIHDIDLALHLNGPIKKVTSYGRKEYGLIAFASANIEHENGSYSRIVASRITQKKCREIQVTALDSFINIDLLRREIVINKQSEIDLQLGKPYSVSSIEQKVEVNPEEPLLNELQSFIKLCQGQKVDVPSVKEGINALQVCEKIKENIG